MIDRPSFVSVQQTLGPLPRLCIGTRIRLQHQGQIGAQGISPPKDQHAAQEDQD